MKLEQFYKGYSVSHGTRVDEHVAEAIVNFLDNKNLTGDAADRYQEIKDEMNFFIDFDTFEIKSELNDDERSEFTELVFEDLFNLVNDIAPEGTSFSAHIGDGSDYGFWEHEVDEFGDFEEHWID